MTDQGLEACASFTSLCIDCLVKTPLAVIDDAETHENVLAMEVERSQSRRQKHYPLPDSTSSAGNQGHQLQTSIKNLKWVLSLCHPHQFEQPLAIATRSQLEITERQI